MLREARAKVLCLRLAVRSQRPADARIVAALAVPDHEDDAFVVLEAVVDILDIDKGARRRHLDKVRIFFEFCRMAPCLCRSIVGIEDVAAEGAGTDFAIRTRTEAHDILQAVRRESDTAFRIADEAVGDLREIKVVRHVVAARHVRHMQHGARIVGTCGNPEFLLVEQPQVLFEIGNRRRRARNPLADTGEGVFRIRTQRPVRYLRTRGRIAPESVVRNIRRDILEGEPVPFRDARSGKQVNSEIPRRHLLFRQIIGEIVHVERTQDFSRRLLHRHGQILPCSHESLGTRKFGGRNKIHFHRIAQSQIAQCRKRNPCNRRCTRETESDTFNRHPDIGLPVSDR